MSDGMILALSGIAVAAITIIPATIQAFSANRKLKAVKETLGDPNGHGDFNQMMTRILAWQAEQTKAQAEALEALKNRDTELSVYSHDRFHKVINMLTIVKGKVDLMWPHFAEQYGINMDDLPSVPYPEIEDEQPT